jgi:hypothetical protein
MHDEGSGLDPGASPMDESTAELLYQTVHDGWLREHFCTKSGKDDPLMDLVLADRDAGLKQIATLSEFQLDHRDAKPCPTTLRDADFEGFQAAVDDFRQWHQQQEPIEEETGRIIDVLLKIANSVPSDRKKG